MVRLSGFFRHLGVTVLLFSFAFALYAQQGPVKPSKLLKHFTHQASKADVSFTIPDDFSEIALNNQQQVSFDYGITIPGNEFEIWFSVLPQKYESADSAYIDIGRNQALKLSGGDNTYFTRNIPDHVLEEYNADAGKTYLISLPDMTVTKHYKYVLLITLQKNHSGIITAAAFTNEKGPDFFKKINKARNCIRFKP